MKFAAGLTVVAGAWLVFLVFAIHDLTFEVDRDAISWKRGVVTEAICTNTSTVSTVTFTIRYDGSPREEIQPIFLRPGESCNEELLRQFTGKPIDISLYENFYMDVIVGGVRLRAADEEIDALNDSLGTWIFMFCIPLFSTLGFVGWSRNRNRTRD